MLPAREFIVRILCKLSLPFLSRYKGSFGKGIKETRAAGLKLLSGRKKK